MSRLLLLVAAAMLIAGTAQAQRLEVDPTRATNIASPILTRPGELIASELSDIDVASGVERSAEYFVFTGRAGEVITAQVRSDIPSLEVLIRSIRSHTGKGLVEGPAAAAPLRLVLPKDDSYVIVVHSRGPQRFGKYLLSLGLADAAPSFDPPKPSPAQVAAASAPAPAPQPAPSPTPAPPAALPPMPVIPGVTNVRIGKPLVRPAGKTGTRIELFAFIGEGGSVLQASAIGAGRYGMTLYTPEGAEMLTATGQGSAHMDAVLPLDGIYLLAVARQDGAKPYKLSLSAEPSDAILWTQRSHAGYEVLDANGAMLFWTCWIDPGTVLQYQMANGTTMRLTLHRDGTGRWELPANGSYNFTTRVEGSMAIRTAELGQVQTWRLDDPSDAFGAYRGYLCN